MKISESDFSNHIIKTVENKIGNIFFFDHIAVIELNEGVHFDKSNSSMITDELILFYGKNIPFGVIANRVNSYSIDTLRLSEYTENMSNFISYGVVGHDNASKMNAEIENGFCKIDNIYFDTINNAINSVYKKVKASDFFSLSNLMTISQ